MDGKSVRFAIGEASGKKSGLAEEEGEQKTKVTPVVVHQVASNSGDDETCFKKPAQKVLKKLEKGNTAANGLGDEPKPKLDEAAAAVGPPPSATKKPKRPRGKRCPCKMKVAEKGKCEMEVTDPRSVLNTIKAQIVARKKLTQETRSNEEQTATGQGSGTITFSIHKNNGEQEQLKLEVPNKNKIKLSHKESLDENELKKGTGVEKLATKKCGPEGKSEQTLTASTSTGSGKQFGATCDGQFYTGYQKPTCCPFHGELHDGIFDEFCKIIKFDRDVNGAIKGYMDRRRMRKHVAICVGHPNDPLFIARLRMALYLHGPQVRQCLINYYQRCFMQDKSLPQVVAAVHMFIAYVVNNVANDNAMKGLIALLGMMMRSIETNVVFDQDNQSDNPIANV